MIDRLGVRLFYQGSYFSEKFVEISIDAIDVYKPINEWDDEDQYQSCHEALKWVDFKQDEVEGLCFKTDHCST